MPQDADDLAPVAPPLHREGVLRDGRAAQLRPLLRSDEAAYRTFTQTVSPESQYYRFFSPRRELSEREIEHFLHVDFVDRLAIVAERAGEIIAVARYDRVEDPATAEVAFIVLDSYQGQGLGLELLRLLAEGAQLQGITRFCASVLPDNYKMLRVFEKSGDVLSRRFEDGVISVELTVVPQPATPGLPRA
jgi:RimJ/RimL family protein N-acetyltransferase